MLSFFPLQYIKLDARNLVSRSRFNSKTNSCHLMINVSFQDTCYYRTCVPSHLLINMMPSHWFWQVMPETCCQYWDMICLWTFRLQWARLWPSIWPGSQVCQEIKRHKRWSCWDQTFTIISHQAQIWFINQILNINNIQSWLLPQL